MEINYKEHENKNKNNDIDYKQLYEQKSYSTNSIKSHDICK